MIRGRSSRSSRLRVSIGRARSRAAAARRRRVRSRPARSPRRGRRGAVRAESDVAVRVDEAGQDPAAVEDGVRVGDRFSAQRAVDDPPLAPAPRPAARGLGHEGGVRRTLLLARELQLRQVDVGEPRGQLVEALGHVGQVREARRAIRRPADCAPSAASARRRPSCPSCPCPSCPSRPCGFIALAAERHAHLARHRRHHLAGLEEPLDELVDLGDRDAGAVGDAQPPRPLMIFGSARSCRRHRRG